MDIYTKTADIVRMVKNTDEQLSTHHKDRDLRVADTVKRNSGDEDTILVWGTRPQIHLLTERDSPTRFFYQYPLIKPNYAKESDLGEFISDVTNGRPAIIIDARNSRLPPLDEASRRDWHPKKRFLHDPTAFQQLFDFVETEYDLIEEIGGYRVYARNRLE